MTEYDSMTMTLWTPRLDSSDNTPVYLQIVRALERDVRGGTLVAGAQLPSHRDLAKDVGITAVTVTRAYSEAARRGLVESSRGRGMFVRAVKRDPNAPAEIDLVTNSVSIPFAPPSAEIMTRAAATINSGYNIGAGLERHRVAGAKWIGRDTSPSRVVVTAGTQHAMFLAFATATRPGDAVFVEALTYHGAKAVAALLHLRLEPLAIDRYGLVPEAFERAAKARLAKVLYTIPTLHNPTGTIMPEKRRREIAAIAEKYGITIIEDDISGFLVEKTLQPIAAFAPDRTLFVTGLGKSLASALRIGYIAAPEPLLPRLTAALWANVLFASPLLAEIAASWIEDGTAARLVARRREEVALRNRIARPILGRSAAGADPRSMHLWIELPKRWTGDTFAEEARRRRVRVASASSFATTNDVPRAVRLSIGAPPTVTELENALQILTSIDEESAEGPVV
jgi:DNA-binding transcriptional MocR family regulator